jgi:hypothetical protein
MSTPDFLNADFWIKRALRNVVAILCLLLFVSLAAHASFGPFLVLGAFAYIALRMWTVVRPERSSRRQLRNTAGAERTPVLPGEARR